MAGLEWAGLEWAALEWAALEWVVAETMRGCWTGVVEDECGQQEADRP